ncbi:SAM-dependent methyltransferase [Flavobacterium sp. 9AF]|uniref:class I SAM-dependent methyltransferase n=1 Tax=Flavobacterium sp. 9AF TaxID=2653142 RepID=UPI0012F07194|nr:class I SAM-dependent methyltransferase [Flavobacterium sp. 9AF]VXB68527.1 SAM-dependent methyltransferase [Flavobacterium sp. 9AF]
MYNIVKRIIKNSIPKRLVYKIEPFLRKLYSYSKKGNNHLCVICNFKMKEWVQLPNQDNLCPNCGSLSRDRRLYYILKEKYLSKNYTILDFSPSRSLFRKLKKEKNIDYLTSDLSGDFIADTKYDITNIPKDTNSFDLILCYHILEHVIDDQKAISELYRVLKPCGAILIQTPFKEGEIYEDYTITSEKERFMHFGQEDHVRVYSVLGLKERLQKVGFKIEVSQFKKDEYFGFSDNESVLIAKK